MNYQESRAFIENSANNKIILGLDNMREMLGRLGNPQDELNIVHVGGTNGKGSVIAFLYSVLSLAGYRVGRYTSPTLFSYRERIEVAGELISRDAFAECATKVADVIEDMTRQGFAHPTPFEVETAIAFLYFKDRDCDLVLLEVGMGGEGDATNIINKSLVSVLVSISRDHTAFLGDSLLEIASVKAGIIKENGTLVTIRQDPSVARVLKNVCEHRHAGYVQADSNLVKSVREDLTGQVFEYDGSLWELSLLGRHQPENAILALKVLEVLDSKGYPVSKEEKKEGLKATVWKGRFTVINKSPLFIVDGAHNPGAALLLKATIETYLKDRPIYYIIGMFRDKDVREVIEPTIGYARHVWCIETPDNPRAMPSGELADLIRQYTPEVTKARDIPSAIEAALDAAAPDGVVLSFGSLSNIGEITDYIRKKQERETNV